MMKTLSLATGAIVAALVSACGQQPTAADHCAPGLLCLDGTIRRYTIEGGFWAIRGDDSTTYEPMNALPDHFQRDGLRVRLRAITRTDRGSYRMVGPVVELIALDSLPQRRP